jgi:uncharacterized membrane protein YqiK
MEDIVQRRNRELREASERERARYDRQKAESDRKVAIQRAESELRAANAKHDQERREDQQKQDRIEQQRRADVRKTQAESSRHNRAMEAGSGSTLAKQNTKKFTTSKSKKKRGLKGPLLCAIIAAVLLLWPKIQQFFLEVGSTASGGFSNQLAPRAAKIFNVRQVSKAQPKSTNDYYPPCSAEVTDHCQQR